MLRWFARAPSFSSAPDFLSLSAGSPHRERCWLLNSTSIHFADWSWAIFRRPAGFANFGQPSRLNYCKAFMIFHVDTVAEKYWKRTEIDHKGATNSSSNSMSKANHTGEAQAIQMKPHGFVELRWATHLSHHRWSTRLVYWNRWPSTASA